MIYDVLKQLNLLDVPRYSTRDLKEIAAHGNATHILRGGFTSAADTLRINFVLQDAKTGENISADKVEGKGEASIYSLVDEMTRKVKVNLRLTSEEIANDVDKELAKITTASPEAYKYYAEARKNHFGIKYPEAIPLYEKAVAIDPQFAMAYRGLAAAYSNMGQLSRSRENSQKAFALSDRVSDRERYIIQVYYYYDREKTYPQAIAACNKLLELYPDDEFGNQYLGLIYDNLEEWDKAVPKYLICSQNQRSVLDSGNLASAYEQLGLYEKARQVYEDYIKNVADDSQVHLLLGHDYLYQGKYDLALAEAEKAFLLNPGDVGTSLLKGDIAHLGGRFAEAEQEYRNALEKGQKSYRLYSRWRLATLCLTQGKIVKAREELRLAGELADEFGEKVWKANSLFYSGYLSWKQGQPDPAIQEIEPAIPTYSEFDLPEMQRFGLACKGALYLEAGSTGQAEKIATELKALMDQGMNRKAMRYSLYLQGLIDLKKGNFQRSQENLNRAVALLPYQASAFAEHAFFIDALASACYKAGRLDEAGEEYQKITELTTGRQFYGDLYAKSFYMLGKIAEQDGDKARARQNYQRFLEIWREADPGFPEVADAKKRLAAL
jgi:tetratricopeptide (TPR) repeat protein